MKVYVLKSGYNYEGSEVLGVFTNEEIAELEKNKLISIDIKRGFGPDYYSIQCCELKGEIEIV